MYKAILVDDEEIVRNGLRSHYPWSSCGIEIAADFSSGREALAYLKEHDVDLLVSDIVMPNMTGLELARNARELRPEIKIIFISGYSDAEYLGDALRLSAVDYIFKPVDFSALDSAIERVVHIVSRQNSEKRRLEELEQQVEANAQMLRQQFLISLLSDTMETEESLAATAQMLSIPLTSRTEYAVMVIRISNRYSLQADQPERNGLLLELDIQKRIQECLNRYGAGRLFKKRSYEYICILDVRKAGFEDTLLAVSSEAKIRLKNEFGAETAIGISESYRGLLNIRMAYKSACESIYNRALWDSAVPDITINKYPLNSTLIAFREQAKNAVLSSIRSGDEAEIARTVTGSIAAIRQIPSPDIQQNLLIGFLMIPKTLFADAASAEGCCYQSHRKLLEEYLLMQDLHEQEDFILRSFLDASRAVHRTEVQGSSYLIRSVVSYIEQHYMEQISIDRLAEISYLTPAYLCVIFKKYTGQTINSYITAYRMEKAKELLATNMHLQDICLQVGYISPSYFAKLFRRHFGMTPREYRESLS